MSSSVLKGYLSFGLVSVPISLFTAALIEERTDALSRHRRILIVDREENIGDTLKDIFGREGYEVVAARSTEEGLTIAGTWQPDLVLTEIVMGSINGLDFAKRIVADHPQCLIILFSGQVARQLVDEALALGFDFFDKPVSPTVLIESVSDLLSK
jgi:DNA-binding NtrC family response regulator